MCVNVGGINLDITVINIANTGNITSSVYRELSHD